MTPYNIGWMRSNTDEYVEMVFEMSNEEMVCTGDTSLILVGRTSHSLHGRGGWVIIIQSGSKGKP